MDRTIVDNYRAKEKEIGCNIYEKLKILTLIHPPTSDFKKIFSDEMFLKPNPKALVHVMHFLFTILDPIEFKKRFYWPVVDKKSESDFRTSSIDYLIYLNNKHNCDWNNINRYLVTMPGGHKFLTFLNDFLDFIGKELVKQREKYLPAGVTLENMNTNKSVLKKLEIQSKLLKKNAEVYVESIEVRTKIYQEKIENIRRKLKHISQETDITLDLLTDSKFLKNFQLFVEGSIKEEIETKVNLITDHEKIVDLIQENIALNQSEKTIIKFDQKNLLDSLNKLNESQVDQSELFNGNELNLQLLLDTFGKLLPQLNNSLTIQSRNSIEPLVYQQNELEKLKVDLLQTQQQSTEFSNFIKEAENRYNELKMVKTPKRILDNRFKLIQTPPITFSIGEADANKIIRLPLMENNFLSRTNHDQFSFANQTTIINPVRLGKKDESKRSLVNKNSNKKSKIIDPSDFLRSLTKSKKPRNVAVNFSELATNWRQKEKSFFGALDEPDFHNNNETKNTRPHSTSPTDQGKIKNFFHENFNPITSPAFHQIQYNSKNFEKFSTSPSGRLMPLVKFDDLPKVLVNNTDLIDYTNFHDIQKKTVFEKPAFNIPQIVFNDTNTEIKAKGEDFVENSLNLTNLTEKFDSVLDSLNKDQDNLCNTSDSVLNEIQI